jgi:mediator of RNA polymerase II transcription subunit 5
MTVIRVSFSSNMKIHELVLTNKGEYQPVYDEFGAILVLIMAFVYRYDLTIFDIGITHDSFVAQLMERGNYSMSPDELTEDQSKHLGGWLKGLYDSGNEGLSNDVFASCRPQDFYLMVPTLFRQTVMACSAGILTFESVKGGLECKYTHLVGLALMQLLNSA